MEYLLVLVVLFLAFSNGANDNFKGLATVWGSETLGYRTALILATLATVAGSLTSLMLAKALMQQFSGMGLVPKEIAIAPQFLLSVGIGAAITVFIATRAGLPVSTTHALIGGLIGAGMVWGSGNVHMEKLASNFLLPMLMSPLLAASLGLISYRAFRRRPVQSECACIVPGALSVGQGGAGEAVMQASSPRLIVAADATCDTIVQPMARVSILGALDRIHVFSAMSICFARGVNDTPKLMGLLITAQLLNARVSIVFIALVMAIGGFLFARQVAETMSHRMVAMDATQGLVANMITAGLVLFASKWGLPVSTTHVSVGSIAGVGAGARAVDWSTVRNILMAWVATLPMAALIAAFLAFLFSLLH